MATTWIAKYSRSFNTIKSAILERFKVELPEVTDYNVSNPLIRLLEAMAGIAEMLHYYLDRKAREAFLSTAVRFSSVAKIAKMYDYRISGAIPAEAALTLTFSAPLQTNFTLPKGTRFATQSNLEFQTIINNTILAGQTTATVRVLQQVAIAGYTITSDGTVSQRVPLVAKIVDGSVTITVDGIGYTHQDTLYLSSPTDNHFTTSINADGVMEVIFGDGQNAVIPPTGATIIIGYQLTEGSLGNVSEQAINEVVSSLTIPNGITMTIANTKAATGGVAQQDINNVRVGISKRMNTIKRAVTEKDFKVLAETFYGVGKAIVLHTCGYTTRLFIAPIEGGEAPQTLLENVSEFMRLRKTINVDLEVSSAGVVGMQYDINVEALPNFSNASVQTNVLATLEEFHSLNNQSDGSELYLSDLYQAIEGTLGVRRSQITRADIIPYARILEGSTVLTWTRKIASTSTTSNVFEIEITSLTDFALKKDGVSVNTYSIGNLVSLPEVEFTITGSYAIGDTWEFYSYPAFNLLSSKLIIADEPSFYAVDLSTSTITVTGGLIE